MTRPGAGRLPVRGVSGIAQGRHRIPADRRTATVVGMDMTHPEQEPGSDTDLPAYGSPSDSPSAHAAAEPEHTFHADEPGRTDQPGRPGDPGTGTPPGAKFFDAIRGLGVVRPDDGRWAAGVCAGLARRWGMNPMAVRGLFVLVSLLAGVGLALYGVLWLFLPHPDGRIHAQQVLSGAVTAGFIGAVIAILFGGPVVDAPWSPGPWHHGPGVFPLILIALLVWWIARRGRAHHAHHGS
jgi:phage shock protein PspC (stress-responsive transcriptional regulator)